jgi:hypothetical protein
VISIDFEHHPQKKTILLFRTLNIFSKYVKQAKELGRYDTMSHASQQMNKNRYINHFIYSLEIKLNKKNKF